MPVTAQRAEPVAALGRRTAVGLGWLILQTLGSKLVAMGSQIVLAWLLAPNQFGTVGLAFTVSSFAGVIQQSGLGEILIQRGKEFRRWGAAASWISAALGCAAGVVMLIAAPFAARIYRTPGLTGLVLVLAATAVVSGLLVVPMARLRIELNFRAMAAINFSANVGASVLSVIFAAAGCGAYSFVLPRLVFAIGQVIVLAAMGLVILRRPQFRRMRLLVHDSLFAFLSASCLTVVAQGDYVALGIARSREVVGLYFFGFNLSAQMIVLLTLNLSGVLLPALSKLNDEPKRQLAAFRRTCSMLAPLGMFASFLQAGLAGPIVRLLFGPKWYPAIPVIQLLSMGMAFSLVGYSGTSLLQSHGRFKLLMIYAAVCASGFVAMVGPAAYWGGMIWVAGAVAVYHFAYGVSNLYLAMKTDGGGWRHVWSVYAAPLGAAVLSVGAGVLLARLLPAHRRGDALRVVLISVTAVLIDLVLIRAWSRETWDELRTQSLSVLGRRAARGGSGPAVQA